MDQELLFIDCDIFKIGWNVFVAWLYNSLKKNNAGRGGLKREWWNKGERLWSSERKSSSLSALLNCWPVKKRFLSSAFMWFSLPVKFKRAITQTNLISWWEVVYIYPHFHTCDSVSKIAGFPQVMQQWKANKQIRWFISLHIFENISFKNNLSCLRKSIQKSKVLIVTSSCRRHQWSQQSAHIFLKGSWNFS